MMHEVQETYAETTLGGSGSFNVELLKNPGVVHITGPTLDKQFSPTDLQSVQLGNTSVLGPELLGILTNQGINPQSFAENLLRMF